MTDFRVHQARIGAEMEGKLSLDWRGCLNRGRLIGDLSELGPKKHSKGTLIGRSKEVKGREDVGDVGNVSRSNSRK